MIHQLLLKYLKIVQHNEGIEIYYFNFFAFFLNYSFAFLSGLTEGDHIIYINSQNVQNFRSFNDIISLIKRTFEENGEITLITLTGPAYQVLKRRGGYLESLAFDYQSSSTDQLKPRLCKLKLYNREQDFGFTLQQNDYLYVKNIEENSSADINGLRKNDIILELNGKIAKNLTINQIKEITDISKQERKLDILVISIDGYQFAMKHAIPLNSLLFFVQTKEEQSMITKKNSSIENFVFDFF
jgi:membrane-associated protease RseP (regulator of RpoE activity)